MKEVEEVLTKQIRWSAGMLCDITDEIEASINQAAYEQAQSFLAVLKEETKNLEKRLERRSNN
jgi:ubiquinone biosynthesis protein UbiJ